MAHCSTQTTTVSLGANTTRRDASLNSEVLESSAVYDHSRGRMSMTKLTYGFRRRFGGYRALLFAICLDFLSLRLPVARDEPRTTVHVKLDNLGDFVIWARSTPRSIIKDSDLLVTSAANRSFVKLLGISCRIIYVDVPKAVSSPSYRFQTLRNLRRVRSERVINYQFSRTILLGDSVVRAIRSPIKLGMRGDSTNQSQIEHLFSARWYSKLHLVPNHICHELSKMKFFVDEIGEDRDGTRLAEKLVVGSRLAKSHALSNVKYVVVGVDSSSPSKTFEGMDRVVKIVASLQTIIGSIDAVALVGLKHTESTRRMVNFPTSVQVIDYVGSTSVEELLEITSGASLVVASDSLIGHLGALFLRPTLVFRTGVLWNRFFPYPDFSKLLVVPSGKECGCEVSCVFAIQGALRPCFSGASDDLIRQSVCSLLLKT